ncbi:hypothetical protein SAMN04488030_2898 [Aliiroseovarius halocynthiae]|uniref:Clp protease n=1 Tax=Aliiroseovarius halocynthiae TaxID=985055 RepID=A0A545SNR2_9RHOB|nr:hypothetical protein [Aliiroseovarius halocynthiae]TQV66584.1 hypothetical protein FIL88_12720 [Aliiroseovarius halocynthiae]SMR82545.1 hypothetical protein SAMN04488030_2898 [Aliiroseovarius halocynthiae]
MGYALDHLRGKHPLWQSFWVNGVAVRLAVYAITLLVLRDAPIALWVAAVLVGADALCLLWQGVGYFRAAEARIRDTGSMLPTWVGMIALVIAVFVVVSQWWALGLATRPVDDGPSFAERKARERQAEYQFKRQSDGNLLFQGQIVLGVTKAMRRELAQAPLPTSITLDSKGGNVFEARGLAKLITSHGLDTHVDATCSSACTLVFIAGSQRQLGPDARLGFHSYMLEGAQRLPGFDIEAEQLRDREFMLGQGVSPDFITRVYDTHPSGIWFPEHRVLHQSGVVTQD